MKSETLQKLIDNYASQKGSANLAAFIVDVLNREEQTLKSRESLRVARAKEIDRHKQAMAKFDEQLEDLQIECSHWETTYHGDPSGGSDSHTTCEICGRQW